MLLSSTLSAIVNQRLVRRLADGASRKPLNKAELAALGKAIDLDRALSLIRAERIIGPKDGWDKVLFGKIFISPDATSSGRIGIYEVLKVSPAVKDLIAQGAKADAIERQARKEGMVTLLEDGIIAAAAGLTSIEEVLTAVSQ